jgi:hypothetical protein
LRFFHWIRSISIGATKIEMDSKVSVKNVGQKKEIKNMSTVANVKNKIDSHWYYSDGRPCYEVPKADGKSMRKATLADARKLNLLPGVSTILKVLHKEALVAWRIEQAVLAILTTPRIGVAGADGKPRKETDDEFTKRVLSTDRVQDEESQKARDRGTEIHDAIEEMINGKPASPAIIPWIEPAVKAVTGCGEAIATESNVVGRGYGGRVDLIQAAKDGFITVWDYKTTKKLPDPERGGAWSEHKLQLSAYAKAIEDKYFKTQGIMRPIKCVNLYISTVDQGKFAICEHDDWKGTFDNGFMPLVAHWNWSTGYSPIIG